MRRRNANDFLTATVSACLLIAACGSPPKSTVVRPKPAATISSDAWDNDPRIARLYGRYSPVGKIPIRPAWSPDSQRISYLRAAFENSDEVRLEIWLYDLKTAAERPLFSHDKSVDAYTWAGSNTIIASAGGDLYQVEVSGTRKQLTDTQAAEESIVGAPDGSKVAFVRNHNLYVLDLLTGTELAVTQGGNRLRTYGEVTWLYREEFKTEFGYGWSPDSTRLWLYETDLSEVPHRDIPNPDGTTRRIPYPRPGENNPIVRVGVVDLSANTPVPRWITPQSESDHYQPLVMWHPNSKQLLLARIDRLQTTLDLLLCDASGRACARVVRENDPRYINLLDRPWFIGNGEEILWLSEQSNYAHIYRIRLSDGARRQITDGSWVVTRINGVDSKQGTVMFTANTEDRSSYKLYRASLDGGDIEALPSEKGCHEALFSPDGGHFLDTHSALDRPPRTEVKTANGQAVAVLAKSDVASYKAPDVMSQIFPFDTRDGRTLHGLLTRPKAIRQDTRYPVLVIVYGGPHGQLVRDAFSTTFQPWRDLLARRGILVFSVDGRGSFGRGRENENAVRLELGKKELEDQLEGVSYLKNLPFVDADRIGVFGWSFGGTMALHALLRTKDVFKLGVAVAPVTDWRFYDTAYTERYMQRPSDNPEGYKSASLIPLVGALRAPLLLVHGLADDNVHFIHTARLFNALMDEGKQVSTLFYPGKGHKLKGPITRPHLFTYMTRFIEERL